MPTQLTLRPAPRADYRAPTVYVPARAGEYRSPTAAERARRLRAAYDASAGDEHQRLLLRELMAHYRDWCVLRGLGDPFVAECVPERVMGAEPSCAMTRRAEHAGVRLAAVEEGIIALV